MFCCTDTWWKHVRYFSRLQTPALESALEGEGVWLCHTAVPPQKPPCFCSGTSCRIDFTCNIQQSKSTSWPYQKTDFSCKTLVKKQTVNKYRVLFFVDMSFMCRCPQNFTSEKPLPQEKKIKSHISLSVFDGTLSNSIIIHLTNSK